MGVGSNQGLFYPKENIIKEKKDNSKKEEKERTKIENISDIFREEEITLINRRKDEKDQGIIKADGKNPEEIYPLYQKIKLNLTTKENTLTNYMVFYVPKDLSQLQSMEYSYNLHFNRTYFIFKETYTKVSSNPKIKKGIGIYRHYEREKEDSPYISSYNEFIITEKNIKNGFIIIETSYNIDFKSYYGYYDFSFSFNRFVLPRSALFIINDNFISNYDYKKKDGKEEFILLNKNKLFAFNREKFCIEIKDKITNINIRDEVYKELLNEFSDKDIDKINFTLNKGNWLLEDVNLIFHKVIHNIKNNKDNIKFYCVVFCPTMIPLDSAGAYSEGYFGKDHQEPIIIKEFKIDESILDKYDNEEEAKENGYGLYGYYISNEHMLKFYNSFRDTFSICELECESNENVDYFRLNLGSLIDDLSMEIGSSFYYEIKLNGNSIKFSDENFKYQIIDDKIILEGFLDDFDEQKYIELAKKCDDPKKYLEYSEKDKIFEWKYLRIEDLIPYDIKLN